MATADGLMGVGVPAEVASRVGVTIVTIAPSNASQGHASGLLKGAGDKIVIATPSVDNGAVTLPSDAGLGDKIEVCNGSASNDVNIYPHSGGTINNGTADELLEIGEAASTANSGVTLRKVTSTNWRTVG